MVTLILICLYNPVLQKMMNPVLAPILLLALTVMAQAQVNTSIIDTQLEWNDADSESIKLDWKRWAEWIPNPKTKQTELQVFIEIPRHLRLAVKDRQSAQLVDGKTKDLPQILRVTMLSKRTAVRLIKSETVGTKKNAGLSVTLLESPPWISLASECKNETDQIQLNTAAAKASALSIYVTCQRKANHELEVTFIAPGATPKKATLTQSSRILVLTNRYDPSDQVAMALRAEQLPQPAEKAIALTPAPRMSPAPSTVEHFDHSWNVWASGYLTRAEHSDDSIASIELHTRLGAERYFDSIRHSMRFELEIPFSNRGLFSLTGEMPISFEWNAFQFSFLPGALVGIFHHPDQSDLNGLYLGPQLGAEAQYDRVGFSSRYQILNGPGGFDFAANWRLQNELSVQVGTYELLLGHSRFSITNPQTTAARTTEWSLGARTHWEFR